ncbi:MAG: hypothetical protein ACI92I_000199 [Acidimicrobiales bacterium]|jgi:hypothetical protein
MATARSKFKKVTKCTHAIRNTTNLFDIGSFDVSIGKSVALFFHNNSFVTSYDAPSRTILQNEVETKDTTLEECRVFCCINLHN